MDTPSDDEDDIWPTKAHRARATAEARRLAPQAAEGGLKFQAYLPPDLATWLLEEIERGVYVSPSEAMFAIVGEFAELVPHADLRRELLRRRCQAALDDPRPSIPAEEVFARLEEMMSRPRPEPAVWTHDLKADEA